MQTARSVYQCSMFALVSIAGLAVRADADITAYAAARYISYTQASDASPTDPEFWYFSALLVTDIEYEVLDAGISFERPPLFTAPLGGGHPYVVQYGSALYDNEAAFLADYPATSYTLWADRGTGVEVGEVFMPEDMYCPEIPAFTGDTHSRLQGLDPAADFVGTVNGFTLAPGADLGYQTYAVVQERVPYLSWSTYMDAGETGFTIPAGTLLPGTNYSIGLTYFNQATIPGAGFGNATSGAEFYRATTSYFRTSQTCDHFVQEFEAAIPCLATGQDCGNTFSIEFETCGLALAEFFTALTHCSMVQLDFYIDGVLAASTAPLFAGDYTGVINFGPLAPGSHTLTIAATGIEGGCNVGILESWGGTLRLHRCADHVAASGPDPAEVCPDAPAVFTVSPSGGGPYSYQWEAQTPGNPGEWILLAEGEIPGIGTIAGSGDAALVVTAPAESGLAFRAVVSNGCSSAISTEAVLTILSCGGCPADFNQDGGIDGADVEAFFAAWEAGEFSADVNSDGGIDGTDVEAFFAAWEAGGCG